MSAGKGEGEPGFLLLLICFILFLAGWFVWHFFKMPILEGLRYMRYAEMWIINLFIGKHEGCLHWLANARFADTSPSGQMVEWANECFSPEYLSTLSYEAVYDHYRLSGRAMTDIERIITINDRWPVAISFCCVGGYIAYLSPRNKFNIKHTLESFIIAQSKIWAIITPIVKFNPSKHSARKLGDPMPDKIPAFAEPFSPEEWVSWHRIPVVNNIPDREATRRAFLLQLGPRWSGSFDNAPIHIQALYAAFMLKGVQKREESDAMLGEISLAWTLEGGLRIPPKLLDKIKRTIRDPEIGGRGIEVANQHAYRTTALLGVLKWARFQGGVLAPAQFIWLRAVDRNLWYPMNNLGRRSFHAEGAGALGHFMAEQVAKKPLPVPRIDTAIVTLNQYLARPDALPIPPREGDRPAKA